MARRLEQLDLPKPRTHGGARAGAGRPRRARRPLVAHRSRAGFQRRSALHVTLRMTDRVYSLRSRRSADALMPALRRGGDRFGVRVVQLSIQGNHVHLLVEAPDQIALGRAMKGFAVRLARALNKMMGKPGQVVSDRYHARRLGTPTEVRSVMHYIRFNHRYHAIAQTAVDEFSSDGIFAGVLPSPTMWILKVGWRRGRPR